MSETNFQPIFEYFDKSIAPVLEGVDSINSRLRNVETSIANLSAQVKANHEEMLVMNHRVDRNEAWMRQVSQKLGIPVPF